MKTLLTFLTIVLFSFNANAFKIGKTYEYCKPFQNNGFEIAGLPENKINSALICMAFLKGLSNMVKGLAIY